MKISRESILKLGKLIITLFLLFVVFSKIEIRSFFALAEYIEWEYIFLAIFVTMLQTVILAWRWYRIIGFLNGRLEAKIAVRLSFLGVFMNQVLPSSIGGDVFRVWGAHRNGLKNGVGFTSVIIDRVTGLLSLSLVVTLAAILVWQKLDDQVLRLSIVCSGPVILCAIVLSSVISLDKLTFLNHHIIRLLSQLSDGLRNLLSSFSHINETLLLGVLASLVGLFAVFVLQQGVGIDLPFTVNVALVGAVTLLSAIPISIGGWGVREVSMVTLFGMVGVSSDNALMLSMLYGIVLIVAAMPGGFLWWTIKGHAKSEFASDHKFRQEPLSTTGKMEPRRVNKLYLLIRDFCQRFIYWLGLKELPLLWRSIYLSFITSLIFLILLKGPVLTDDSSSYINHWPTRSPGYPCLLDLFGGHYYILIFSHTLAGIFSVLFFCSKLSAVLLIPKKYEIFVSFLLLVPYFPLSIFFGIANLVGTESVSYSLFLVSIGYFIYGLVNNDRQSILLSCLMLFFLMLTRKQFIFLYPVYVVMLLCKRNYKKSLSFVLIIFISYFAANVSEKIYNGINNSHYTGIPFTGIQLVIRPLWISDQNDVKLFSGINKEVFVSVLQAMDTRKVSLKACKESNLPIQCGYHHFLESYNIICWQILYPILKSYGITDWWVIDKMTLDFTFELIRNNAFEYFVEYYSAVKNGDGFYYSVLLVLSIIASVVDVFRRNSVSSQILLMVSMMSLANILLVSIAEPLLQRYTFYTSFLQIAVIILLLIKPGKYECVE
jgi:uncharacterized protein (TIRG00374 family)